MRAYINICECLRQSVIAQVNVISIGIARNPVMPVIGSITLGALGRRFESCRPDSKNLLFAMGLAII